MSDQPYLIQLNARLAGPLAGLPAAARQAAAAWLRARQAGGGGFVGRAGPEDLYYSAFALRALAMLDGVDAAVAQPAQGFLERCRPAGLIDLVSYLSASWTLAQPDRPGDDGRGQQWRAVLAAHQTAEGGFAKAPGGPTSTYHTFLGALCREMLDEPLPAADQIVPLIRGRQRGDGGFAELPFMPAGSTNATAAALALVLSAGQVDVEMLSAGCEFLLRLQRDDGGWPASAQAASSDLLSTFTALLTLSDLESTDQADLVGARRFMEACRRDAAFAGWPEDPAPDVEYTFYGLGCVSLLSGRVVGE